MCAEGFVRAPDWDGRA